MSEAVIYCQLQNNLPKCAWISMRKTREMWGGDIYLICPKREAGYEVIKELGIKVINKEDYDNEPLVVDYVSNTFLDKKYPNWDGFWDNTCKRFIYMYLLMKKQGITSAFHVETDVIVYLPISEMFKEVQRVYASQLGFTPHEPEALNCGFSYFGSHEILGLFCEKIIEYMKRGEAWFNEKYPKHPIINETLFAYNFHVENSGAVGLFPALPDDDMSFNLGFLIDPDGWGRWVDGVRYEPGKRYAAKCHYIGNMILNGTYDVHFSFDGRKINRPYAHNTTTKKSYPIATLHFNSKEPEHWI